MTTYYCTGGANLDTEILVDPSFTTGDAAWLLGTGWAFSDPLGSLVATAATSTARQTPSTTVGDYYRFSTEIENYTSGSAILFVSGTSVLTISNSAHTGTQTLYYKVTTSGLTGFSGTAYNATIGSMSLKHVITSGSGTAADPWIGFQSIDTGSLNPGDIVYITGNITDGFLEIEGVNGTTDNPIIFKMAPNARWNYSNGQDSRLLDRPAIYIDNCSNIKLDSFRIRGSFRPFWDHIHTSAFNDGIVIDTNCSNIDISDCSISNFTGCGIQINSTANYSINIYNTDIYDNAKNGMTHGGTYGARIIGCNIYHNGNTYAAENGDGKGIGLNVGNAYCMYNYFEGNGSIDNFDDFEISCDGEAIPGDGTGLPVYVIGNLIKNAYHGGISLFQGVPNSYVGFNIIDGFNSSTTGTTTGCFSGVRVGTATAHDRTYTNNNITISNNIFKNNLAGHSSGCITFGLSSGDNQSGLKIYNNIFIDSDDRFFIVDDLSDIDNADINNNCYYNSDGVYTNKWSCSAVAGGANYNSLAEWQAGVLLADADGFVANPNLLNDYSLSSGSPCIGVGKKVSQLIDFNKNSLPTRKFDIGPIWYIASTSNNYILTELETISKTSNYTITNQEASTYNKFDNNGASGIITFSLPPAEAGMELLFERVSSYVIRIDPYGTELFVGSVNGSYKSLDADGAYINIKCISAGIWHVVAAFGTISDE